MTVIAVEEGLRRRREAIVRGHLEAEASGDPDAILATFTHARYELVGGTGRVYDGIEEVRRYLIERREAFPDLHTEVIGMHHSPDAVIAELWLVATHRGRLGDLDPSGKSFRCRVASFFEFSDINLVGIRTYFDMGTIARQLA
jgi:steroid delta-isomerase-like uncharacterized protein